MFMLGRWLSQEQDLINETAMRQGVRDAKVLLMVTTSDILKPERHWVHLEVAHKHAVAAFLSGWLIFLASTCGTMSSLSLYSSLCHPTACPHLSTSDLTNVIRLIALAVTSVSICPCTLIR